MEKPMNASNSECLEYISWGPSKREKSCHRYFVNGSSIVNEDEEEVEWESNEEEGEEEFQSKSYSETWYVGVRSELTRHQLLLWQLLLCGDGVEAGPPSSSRLPALAPSSLVRVTRLTPSLAASPTPPSEDVVDSRILILPTVDSFNMQSYCVKVITEIMKAHFVEAHPSFGKVPDRMKNIWYVEFKVSVYIKVTT
ncbi:hypothetical protein M9H77_18523 [Catharanthus roseus]|uniref:Uncharacterized protein n=1 Tax=Catharanthus roseus TaxID=4058 RepID=A0ACC0B7R4_CATRO|nr:hypothetical protein M9H77_18523 [Catharanthus roseus]